MGEAQGPFKIVLTDLERTSSPDTLGDPGRERAQAELARLFDIDGETASSILSAIPIVVLDGLDGRTAGIVRERLTHLVALGCRVTTTDAASDDIPRVNWPQLPHIARVDPEPEPSSPSAAAAPPTPAPAAGLRCPCCGAELQLVAAGAGPADGALTASPDHAHAAPPPDAPTAEPAPAATATPSDTDDRLRVPLDDEADWLDPPNAPGTRPRPTQTTERRSTRFDDPVLLQRQREVPPPETPPPPPLDRGGPRIEESDESGVLRVSFSEDDFDANSSEAPLEDEEPEPAPAPAAVEPAEIDLDDSATFGIDDSGSFSDHELIEDSSSRGDLLDSDDLLGSAGGWRSSSERSHTNGRRAAPERERASRPALDLEDSGPDLRGGAGFEDSGVDLEDSGIDLGDSGAELGASGSGLGGAADLEESPGAGLEDSGSDILAVPPPHRREDTSASAQLGRPPDFQSDLELLDSDQGGLDDLLEGPATEPRPGREARPARESRAARDPGLDEVLSMFGPEDDEPLDDGRDLDPEPLDLSPAAEPAPAASRGRTASTHRASSSRAPFDDDLSDILEPLNPDEALRIMKTQGRGPSGGGRASTVSSQRPLDEADEPSGLEPLDPSEAYEILAADNGTKDRAKRKRTRGVPFSASDEDVSLFEESSHGAGSGARSKNTDPFARARRALDEEQPAAPARTASGGRKRERSGRAKTAGKGRERTSGTKASGGRERSGGHKRGTIPPPYSEGNHGLVLSRINDPDQKEQAAELIAEIKGCTLDEARRLTDRTIIPVLKGVSRDLAEHHLARFKDCKIAGRVTTRQRG